MKPYEIVDHTADVRLKVNGATLKELFQNAAFGMFAVISGNGQSGSIKYGVTKAIYIKREVEALEELLVDWLSELLYIFSKEKIFFKSFEVSELNNSGIKGEAHGDNITSGTRAAQTEIKAVTFHGLKIQETARGFSCNIIFDI